MIPLCNLLTEQVKAHKDLIPNLHFELSIRWLSDEIKNQYLDRHSSDSSSVDFSSFLMHSCMILAVSIFNLYNSPMNRMLPNDLRRARISFSSQSA